MPISLWQIEITIGFTYKVIVFLLLESFFTCRGLKQPLSDLSSDLMDRSGRVQKTFLDRSVMQAQTTSLLSLNTTVHAIRKKKRHSNYCKGAGGGGGGEGIELYCVGGVFLTEHLIINQLNIDICHSLSRIFDVNGWNYCKLWPKTFNQLFLMESSQQKVQLTIRGLNHHNISFSCKPQQKTRKTSLTKYQNMI